MNTPVVLLRQPTVNYLEAYGPFANAEVAMDAATRRWGNDPQVVIVPLMKNALSYTMKLQQPDEQQ